MIGISRIAAAACAAAVVGAFALPASAQYASEYAAPKLTHRGSTTKSIAGTGIVIVQVQVNPDGSHHALRVIRSTNPGDNAAALEIAQTSTYRPAHRGKTPVPAFYDFTLKFTGKAVAASSVGGGGMSGSSAQIDRMIRAGNYAGAKAKAQEELGSNPNDPILNSELGAANYFLADYPAAADAFMKVSSIPHEFAQVAANSFTQAAQKLANSDPQRALSYAQRAVQMAPTGGGAYYALGAAELNSGNATQATTDLKKARDLVFADPKSDTRSKVNVDAELYAAQSKAGDAAAAQTTMNEIKRLDPNNATVATLAANNYITQGQAAVKAGNYQQAISDFEQAAGAANGNSQVLVTAYTSAAFAQSQMLNSQKTPPTLADYVKMKGYADKALAANANDPNANFAEGVALASEYVVGGKTDSSLKSQALTALNKAKAEAQSSGMMSLSLNIDSFIKQYLQ